MEQRSRLRWLQPRRATARRSRGPTSRTRCSHPRVRARRTASCARAARDRQRPLALGDTYELPGIDLLKPPPLPANTTLDKAALERNARLLESLLGQNSPLNSTGGRAALAGLAAFAARQYLGGRRR